MPPGEHGNNDVASEHEALSVCNSPDPGLLFISIQPQMLVSLIVLSSQCLGGTRRKRESHL